jgi:hypothetical protein
MPLQALGYVGFGSSSLDDWRPVLRCRLEPAGSRQGHSGPSHNDPTTSFYAKTPSSFMVECGWGGREIDPPNWRPCGLQDGPSL